MQERIIEIIVYLLTELQQERKRKEKLDLSRELILRGYTETEVNLGFSWIYNHLKKPINEPIDQMIEYVDDIEEMTDIDQLILSPEAYGYLLHLIHLGVIKEKDIENFVEKALSYGKNDINVDDLKSIVATIIFTTDGSSFYSNISFNQKDMTIQ